MLSPITVTPVTATKVASTVTFMALILEASASDESSSLYGRNMTIPSWVETNAQDLLKDWGFALNIILLATTMLLQYGYASRSMFMYVLKMTMLWLLWPFTLLNSIFTCVYPIDRITLVLSAIMTATVSLMWLLYFVNSTRLFLRTGSFWAFNPESNMLLTFQANGNTVVRPILEDSPAFAALVMDRKVTICGMSFGHASLDEMPKQLTVGKPNVLVAYKAVKTVRYNNSAGFVVYAKFKAGNYRTPETKRSEELAVLVA